MVLAATRTRIGTRQRAMTVPDRAPLSGTRLATRNHRRQPMSTSLLRYLFGKDIFISYSRLDGKDYAAALADALIRRKFSVALDQFGALPSITIPPSVMRELRRASTLVVVGSAQAAGSAAVGEEVACFPLSKRPVVPIDVAGAARTADWFHHIEGVALERETEANLRAGTPAAGCLQRIGNSVRSRDSERVCGVRRLRPLWRLRCCRPSPD
jgi:hypothetical protein